MKSTNVQGFLANIDKRGPDECWPWMRCRSPRGYGVYYWRGKTARSNRIAYELENGPIPEGMLVLHSCDNPPCCNPAHLHLGTHEDNMRERDERNRNPSGPDHWSRHKPERLARGDKNGARVHPENLARGERNGHYTKPEKTPHGEAAGPSVLTESQVQYVLSAIVTGRTYASIAKELPVSKVSIRNIAIGKTWRHVSRTILTQYDQSRIN